MDTAHWVVLLILVLGTPACIAGYVYATVNGPRWAEEKR
jgi:hypothetical protein